MIKDVAVHALYRLIQERAQVQLLGESSQCYVQPALIATTLPLRLVWFILSVISLSQFSYNGQYLCRVCLYFSNCSQNVNALGFIVFLV